MTDFSKLLNPEQFAAATAGDGPLLVLAAAGTGKTRTLVHRVAYLVERGIPAHRILLLTFTNRAAREMLDRARVLSGDSVASIWSGTFHSICARFLRRWGGTLGYDPGFLILDEEDQKKILGEIIKESVPEPKDFPKKDLIAKMISEAANEQKDIRAIAARWLTKTAGIEPEAIAAIAEKYVARKRELGAMDFDDLLVNGLRLLKEQPKVREMLQEHFLYVLVDEYQDTNGIQAEFTDILAAKHRNILAVGDDFQCIYTWRGAQIENIMEFPQRWFGCRVIKLERNYRSVPSILDVANVVMKDAPHQFEKQLRAYRADSGDRPFLFKVYNGKAQATEISRILQQMLRMGYRHRDLAILYRSHFHSMDIQLTLTRMGIPFKITSGVGMFEQIHIKDTLAYLRLLVNANDELSFARFICLLPGVGEKGAKKVWEKLGRSFDCHSKDCRDKLSGLLPAKARPHWPLLARCFEAARDHLEANELGEVIDEFCELFYEDHLQRMWEEADANSRLDDVKELAVQIAGEDLETFLADVALLTNLDAKKNVEERECVTLSTIHQAKGMEWPVVFVPWLSEGMFPSAKATEEGRIDEERRLFYVVVTRAKDRLFMFSPMMRKTSDGGEFPVEVSDFIKEIPDSMMTVKRVEYTPAYAPSASMYSKRRW